MIVGQVNVPLVERFYVTAGTVEYRCVEHATLKAVISHTSLSAPVANGSRLWARLDRPVDEGFLPWYTTRKHCIPTVPRHCCCG